MGELHQSEIRQLTVNVGQSNFHKTALLKIIKRVFSEQPLKKRNQKLGTTIANPEPAEAGHGEAAARAVMELSQERLSDP